MNMAQTESSTPIVIGQEPTEFKESLDPEEEKKFWRNIAKEREKGRMDRAIDGLKQIINLNGIILGVYFATLSISSLNNYLVIRSNSDIIWVLLLLLPAIVWLLSLGFAISALCSNPIFPKWTNDAKIIEESWRKEFEYLSSRLTRSRITLLIGFGLMILNIAVYIYVSCDP